MIIDWNSGFYRCWNNDITCTDAGCNRFSYCSVEESQSVNRACNRDERIRNVLQSLYGDYRFQISDDWEHLHFSLTNINRFTRTRSSNALYPVVSKQNNWIDFSRAWKCNRGVLIHMGIEQSQYCLCSPSYYGDRCQFQSERIGLTLQLNNECSPSCRGVYRIIVTPVDDEQTIHSHEQFTYIPTAHCHIKYNLYLLYRSRPKNPSMNYTIHIDVYEGINLIYSASWTLPVQIFPHCPLICGDHGQFWKSMNDETYFCRCHSDLSGSHCNIERKMCNCALDSICAGLINNRSICLCPLHKSGSRCLLSSICQQNPCRNGAQCVPDDYRLSLNTFTCICPIGYSGKMCEMKDTIIEIAFDDVNIPQSFWTYLITVRRNDDPLISAISMKVSIVDNVVTLSASVEFNLIFIQIENEFYLIFLQSNATRFVHL